MGLQENNSRAVLVAEGITHRFDPKEPPIMDEIELTVNVNERIAITGPSGAGKSTLLHIMSGLKNPTQGRVMVDQYWLNRMSDEKLSQYRNQKIGFVYQSDSLLRDFNTLENISLPLIIRGERAEIARQHAVHVMSELNMQTLAQRMPSQLSGGERQRIAIARALIIQPVILFADEPTGNLDAANTERVMDTLLAAQKIHPMACVIATHDQSILKYFDRVIDVCALNGVNN
jgi:ABC-type lipoprotein export system ATPase subunit